MALQDISFLLAKHKCIVEFSLEVFEFSLQGVIETKFSLSRESWLNVVYKCCAYVIWEITRKSSRP